MISVTLSGIFIFSRAVQFLNEFFPILVIALGISMFLKAQPSNASEILVTVFGIIKSVSEVHPLNVPFISVIPSGREAEIRPVQPENVKSPRKVTVSGTVTDVSPAQSENAEIPIEVTERGISMFDKDEQPEKQLSRISVIQFGIFIEVSLEQFEKAL